ncbi:MAG TPA: GNAT family N-acetyltransferase, partial [Vicinamibacterales bacterium]|nr:GNAT family N-acetyltransferase [Vicinamibacterales bacterium]
MRDLYARLSPRSRYLRFLIAASELPEALLRILLDVDGRRRLAFVAEDAAREDGDAVGLASFGAVDEHSVELGLVVRDDWQRQHVGTELAIRVMEAAED